MGAHRLAAGAFAFAMLGILISACSSEEAGADPTPIAETRGGPGCANGRQDDGESGVDCGGVCGKCGGDPCAEVAECKSGECKDGQCTTPVTPGVPGPTNGIKDNGETDVDCGGPNAPACAAGKTCAAETDCADEYCPEATPRVCVTPKADDGVLNGTETDVDCGGAAPTNAPKCLLGKKCVADADCASSACNYKKICVEAPSCRPQYGGDTCGAGDFEDAGKQHESCCKTLPVAGFSDPSYAGKQVYLDKYEITAGRVRAFIEDIAAKSGGEPNIKAWVAANKPKLWSSAFDFILPSGNEVEAGVSMPHPNVPNGAPATNNVGLFYNLNATRYTYVHGENCFVGGSSYGYPTFFFPPNVQTLNGAAPRAVPNGDNGALAVGAKEQLDMKSMNCIPAAVLAAFCHWDGGQLATDEVLDFVTATPATLGFAAGCGSRCAPRANVHVSSDSGSETGHKYYYPYYAGTTEGTSRVAPPGRVAADVVRINAGDEPWMDLRGNMIEVVLDVAGATFNNQFGIKYEGIGYSSARAGGNSVSPTPPALAGRYNWPEYKAAYSGGRCMRFK